MSFLRTNNPLPQTVVVIGGGVTGTGIAREASRRGFRVVLVERGELGCGTSSHFHGILHSGARYAVNDPETAAECYQENQLLRSLIPSAIRDTGGLFVALNDDDAAHADILMKACRAAGIPTREINRASALAREPGLNRDLQRAFTVPDGFIDGAEVIRLNQQAALAADEPAIFLTNRTVTGFEWKGGRITAVTVRHSSTQEVQTINCAYVVNAGGVWAGQVAALADIKLPMVYDKGTMIAFREELVQAVINRCRPEADGDLLVPGSEGSIIGTTARVIDDPDDCLPSQEEADVLLREGSALVPALARAEAVRIYAGVRPLFGAAAATASSLSAGTAGIVGTTPSTRAISRSYRVLDHGYDGINNFMSVVGGKVTLYRRMAAAAVDLLDIRRGSPATGNYESEWLPDAPAVLQNQ